jgi:hypothetical protein
VKKETTKATSGGKKTHVVTPETGNVTYRKSISCIIPLSSTAVRNKRVPAQT